MSQASFTVNLSNLRKLFNKFDSEKARALARQVIAGKQVQALLSQAIADNFAKEGPGWKPLTNQTIRSSVSKTMRKRLIKVNGKLFDGKTGEVPRQILRRTGTLMKSVTTPGAQGNIYRIRNMTIEWGTNLHYAAIHNRGGTIDHPGSKNAFGIKGLNTKSHKIMIPARPYLRLSDYWKAEINAKVAKDFIRGLKAMWSSK
jgi:phage gpG-like protein